MIDDSKPMPIIRTGADLKALRHRFGLSQRDIANLFRITQARISEWENGKDMSLAIQWAFTGITRWCEDNLKPV